ncbi:hypothetical protein BGZ51_007848, partial [Haplosporangium sp. Z 767]
MAASNNPQITIPGLGTVQGVLHSQYPVARFLGIPFGTVVERWRPAIKTEPWQGVREATKDGPICPQATHAPLFIQVLLGVPECRSYEDTMSERDCLNCNIFMPASAVKSGEKLPVLVWIHGGGLVADGITSPLYDCSDLVNASIELNKPMIVVAINYRVNYHGFISSKELLQDAEEYIQRIPEEKRKWYDGSIGNWGILDQILGLEWVQDNIHAFSGDPKAVTLMGESAGAICISYLQQIPNCNHLFRRSILQSGAHSSMPSMRPQYEGQRYFDHLCKVFDVPSELSALEKVAKLRAVPEKDLALELNKSSVLFFSPTLDGVLFKRDSRLDFDGASPFNSGLDWIVAGNCADEGSVFGPLLNLQTLPAFAKLKARLCDPADSELFDQIFGVPKTDAETIPISSHLVDNAFFRFPVLQASEAVLAHPTCQLTRFHFDAKIEAVESVLPGIGAHHGVDMFFTFGTKPAMPALTTKESAFIRQVQQVWIEVVTAKSPSTSKLPKVSHVLPLKNEQRGDTKQYAIVFGSDLEKGEGAVERMSTEEIKFWRRSIRHAAKQAALGNGADYGLDLFTA